MNNRICTASGWILVMASIGFGNPLCAAEGDQAWITCGSDEISALTCSSVAPLAIVGTIGGRVMLANLQESLIVDSTELSGRVAAVVIRGEQRRWYAANIVDRELVLTAGVVSEANRLVIEQRVHRPINAERASLTLSPDGDFVAVVVAQGPEKISVEVLTTSYLTPVFSAYGLDAGAPEHGDPVEQLQKIAFFGKRSFAYPLASSARASVIGIRDLDASDELIRVRMKRRIFRIFPSLCGRTFRVISDVPFTKDGIGQARLLQYTGKPSNELVELGPLNSHFYSPQEIGCDGSFVSSQWNGIGLTTFYRVSLHSERGRETLFEKVKHGYDHAQPIAMLGRDRGRLAIYASSPDTLYVVNVARGKNERHFATEFSQHPEYVPLLRLGGEMSRYAVLANSNPRPAKRGGAEENLQNICVIDLGELPNTSNSEYSEIIP